MYERGLVYCESMASKLNISYAHNDNDTLQKKLTDSAANAEPAETMIASAEMIFMMLEMYRLMRR